MKSISDILNSLVQPAEQNPLFGSNSSVSNQSGNSQVGSFGDVLSRLASQDGSQSNGVSNAGAQTTNSGVSNQLTPAFSAAQLNITDVQVKETIQASNLTSTELKNIETTVASLASALSQLVQLASNLQNLNSAQAQDLLVQASGGAISASQAQQLVAQLTAFKNQQSGQDVLNLTAAQQGALVSQALQTLLQNQQVTLTSASADQGVQNNSNSSQNFSALNFNFSNNQNGQSSTATVESLSINIETLNLQVSNTTPATGSANDAASVGLTDATTQKLTQLLQQLNVAPSSTPVNIQVQSSVATANSPQLEQNFKNLVQILTQAGAGQVVLNNFLSENKNNVLQGQQSGLAANAAPAQSNAVTSLLSTGSANTVSISNTSQSRSTDNIVSTREDLSIQTSEQNIQIVDVQLQTTETTVDQAANNSASSAINAVSAQTQPINNTAVISQPVISVSAAQNLAVSPADQDQQTTASVINASSQQLVGTPAAVTAPTVNNNAAVQSTLSAGVAQATASAATQPVVTPAINNTQAQSVTSVAAPSAQSNNVALQLNQQPQSNASVIQAPPVSDQVVSTQPQSIAPVGQSPVVSNTASAPAPAQPVPQVPQTPVISSTASVPQTQPVASVVTQDQSGVVPASTQLTPDQTASAATSDITTATFVAAQVPQDQQQLVFSNGQLDALNTIVARFNGGIVQNGPKGPETNTLKGNTQIDETIRPVDQTDTVAAVTAQAVVAAESTTKSAVPSTIADQNTQATNFAAQTNVQDQSVQSNSPTQQQSVNNLNVSNQNAFVQAVANTTAAPTVNTTATTPVQTPVAATTTNNQATISATQTPVAQVAASDQTTIQVSAPTSTSTNPVTAPVEAPVVTQPVVNPASITAQDVPAAIVAGEVAKASVATPVAANALVATNQQVVEAVSPTQAIQPVTAQAVTQTPVTSESSTSVGVSVNGNKDALANATDLENLVASVNAAATSTSIKSSNSFQSTVNSINTPNGSVTSAQIMNQISQQVAAQADSAKMVSRLNFQLVPESLGRVTVQVALVDQAVSARIIVSNPDVKEVLQQHMVDLKAALSQAGLQIDQMQVHVQGGGANLLAQYYQYQQEGNSYRGSAWTPEQDTETPQTADNSTVSGPVYSNRLVNILA